MCPISFVQDVLVSGLAQFASTLCRKMVFCLFDLDYFVFLLSEKYSRSLSKGKSENAAFK